MLETLAGTIAYFLSGAAAHGGGHPAAVPVQAGAVEVEPLLGLIPLLPLVGALSLSFFIGRPPTKQAIAGWLGTLFAALSFGVTVLVVQKVIAGHVLMFSAWKWLEVGLPAGASLDIEMAFRMDNLAAVMTLVVTGVGSLIHLYAVGYMAHDPARARFFCYLNLFLCAMLLLVLGSNMLVMFVGWEGVGLCSYLLIGFWYKEMPNAVAGQKAFVVNRIGDAGFLLGMFLLILNAQTLDFETLHATAPALAPGVVLAATLLLFVGAMGKSAQIPLYVWLPDAMAGPTPVSALIHAATMVTAGVYMVTRLSFLYLLAPQTLAFICLIGALTAFFSATIALAQTDIKRVLAYSTVSQLGFMFMALGAGAFANGIYHVVTHAFFKACLFMSAGAVIVACHHEQDMRRFGGLWKKLLLTFAAYLAGTLAISGFPGLSGFYSKDAILWSVYSAGGAVAAPEVLGLPIGIPVNKLAWALGTVTAFLTAFYMTRSLVLTFAGQYRGGHAHAGHSHDVHAGGGDHGDLAHESDHASGRVPDEANAIEHDGAHGDVDHHHHAHDDHGEPTEARSDMRIMIAAIAPLAVLSLLFSFFYGDALVSFLAAWSRPDMLPGHAHGEGHAMVEHLALAAGLGGILLAAVLYIRMQSVVASIARSFAGLHRALVHKWYIDELYDAVIVTPLRSLAAVCFSVIDRSMIDAMVNGTWMLVGVTGDVLRRAHTGRIGAYVMLMLFGTVFLTAFWILL